MQIAELWFSRLIKPLVFIAACMPAFYLAWGAWQDQLGANPIEALLRNSGDWAFRFLVMTLTISPLRRLLHWPQLIRLRRMLGLFAFFYASLHLSLYIGLDQFFAWREIGLDILKRPFITVGMLAFLLMLPLALTSTQAMMKWLGKRWQRLHRWIYPSSVLAILHFWWMKASKADISEPLIYALILAALLGERLYRSAQQRLKT